MISSNSPIKKAQTAVGRFCRTGCNSVLTASGILLSLHKTSPHAVEIPSRLGPLPRGSPLGCGTEHRKHLHPGRVVQQLDPLGGAGCRRIHLGRKLRRAQPVGRQTKPQLQALGKPDPQDHSHRRRHVVGIQQLRIRPVRSPGEDLRTACAVQPPLCGNGRQPRGSLSGTRRTTLRLQSRNIGVRTGRNRGKPGHAGPEDPDVHGPPRFAMDYPAGRPLPLRHNAERIGQLLGRGDPIHSRSE